MTYTVTCPRCGQDFEGDSPEVVADQVLAHARDEHRHSLDHNIVIAHLRGEHPFERD